MTKRELEERIAELEEAVESAHEALEEFRFADARGALDAALAGDEDDTDTDEDEGEE